MKYRFLSCIIAVGFLLGCYKGYLALWTGSQPEPTQVFPYPVSALPPADQEALKKGIYAEDQLDLARLLEDYLS